MTARWLALALALLGACTYSLPPVPSHGGPAWVAIETTRVDAVTGHATVGTPAKGMVRGLPRIRLLSAADLFACERSHCMDFRFYLTAWALYSFLINTRAEELMQLESALDHGMALEVAWDTSIPSLPRDAIDRELRAWLQQGSHRIWSYTAKLRDHTVIERALGDADVYAARAFLRWALHHRDPQLPSDLNAALAANPDHPLAKAVQRAMAGK